MSVRNYCFLILSLTATLLLARPASAQSEARIQIVQKGVNPLKEDLKYLVDLAPNPALKKQWKETLEPLIDSFADGIDPDKPIRVDIVIGKENATEMHFPLKSLKDFKANVKGLGYEATPVPGAAADTFFTLAPKPTKGSNKSAPKKPLYFRVLNKIGSIAPTKEAVPPNMPEPIKAVQPLLDKNYDVVASLVNSNSEKDMASRKKNFQELRHELEAAMVFKRTEDKNEFALRKLSLLQNLNEAERFLVETEELVVGWTTTIAANGTPGKGRAEFSISALGGTDLFKSTEMIAAKSSYFANVQLNKESVVSGKVNFAIDSLRAGHLKEFYKTVRPVVDAQIDKRQTLDTAEKKAAAKEGAGHLLDLLSDGLVLNVVDGFLDMHPAGTGSHTLVCGIRAADGKVADKIVKLLPKLSADREVKMDIQEIGGASLHSAAIPTRRLEAFQKLFPGEKVIYVATSKDAIWGAAGVNAVAELTAAIEQAAGAAPEAIDPRVAYFQANTARFVDMLDILRPEPQKIDESLSKEEQARLKRVEKELDQVKKLAIDAMKNCEPLMSGEVKKNGNKVEGWMDVNECVLTIVGSFIADFAKNMQ